MNIEEFCFEYSVTVKSFIKKEATEFSQFQNLAKYLVVCF